MPGVEKRAVLACVCLLAGCKWALRNQTPVTATKGDLRLAMAIGFFACAIVGDWLWAQIERCRRSLLRLRFLPRVVIGVGAILLLCAGCAPCVAELAQRCTGPVIQECSGGRWRSTVDCGQRGATCAPPDASGPAYCAPPSTIAVEVSSQAVRVQRVPPPSTVPATQPPQSPPAPAAASQSTMPPAAPLQPPQFRGLASWPDDEGDRQGDPGAQDWRRP